MRKSGSLLLSLSAVLFAAACTEPADESTTGSSESALASNPLDRMNLALAARGSNLRAEVAEYITRGDSGQFGSTVFASDHGNRQLDFHFAPGLTFQPGAITYAYDRHDGAGTGLTGAQGEAAIDRVMNTWGHVNCAPINMVKNTAAGNADFGIVQWFFGAGGSPDLVVGDVVDAGFLPGSFFDQLAPGGSQFIIGVTFTLIYTDGNGNPIDTNGDHRGDAAVREIYYNNTFTYTDNNVDFTSPLINFETVALHETGHGLSQAHSGRIFFDGKGTKEPGFQVDHLHFSPRAVMNAIYWDTQRAPLTTDHATHCENWAGWH